LPIKHHGQIGSDRMSIFVTVSFQTIKIKYCPFSKVDIFLQSFKMKEWFVSY
jgi:hypothetical protein